MGKCADIDLLNAGLPQTFNVLKKKKKAVSAIRSPKYCEENKAGKWVERCEKGSPEAVVRVG